MSTATDVDEVARAVAGERLPLNIAEREEAVRRLHATGLSDRQVAGRIHVARKTVLRIRHRLGLPASRDRANRRITDAP